MSTSVCYEKTDQDCPDDEFYDIIRSQCVADGTGINVPQGMSNGHCYSKESLKTWLSRKPQNEDLFGGKFNDADKKLIYDAHKFSTDYIEQLVNAGNHDQAVQLFDQTLQYAGDFNVSEIENLATLGLWEQAVQLFEQTLKYAGDFNVSDIENLTKLGLWEQAVQLWVDTGETLAEILDSRYALRISEHDIYKLKQIGILGRYSRIGYT
jgi:tetratricopeptide (TPR) repeat protein